MPRRQRKRKVEHIPEVTYFKPAGIPTCELEEEVLTIDEMEAIRLKDIEGLDQQEAAESMGVARSTYQLILHKARGKVAKALVIGKAIRVQGGSYQVKNVRGCHRNRGKGDMPFND
ncbi:DUF134 domain-containing protein [Natranaerobius trueperi]|uniref:UPF0251 protein CDO51_06360 n=1 Tax=Natranaerobius trueperi TaxID=759412 RepID=A0A226BZT4_9FIRM|nr:DUF134 domain-containing protein [Natranaerobius trueperi]OWZ83854.1 hypothetical protein CDO51_06360 [Natranaerobius trueperi]